MSERSSENPGQLDDWAEYYDVKDVILDPQNPDTLERLQQSGGYTRPVEYFGGAYIANRSRRHIFAKLRSETSEIVTPQDAELPDIMARIRDDLVAINEDSEVSPLFEVRSTLMPAELRDKIFPIKDQLLSVALQAVDDDTLRDFIVWNKSHIDSLQEKMLPDIHYTMGHFRSRVEHAIRYQNLPLTLHQLETRMAHLTIVVVDPVSMLLHNAEGDYRPSHLQATVPATDDPDYLARVLFHESLHHLSGKTILDRGVTRTDLAFDINTVAPSWMSEANTEQLAALFLSDATDSLDFDRITSENFFTEDQHGYPIYRKVMQTLCSGDQRLTRLLLAAYFEDARPHDQGQLRHTKLFWQTLATSLRFNTPEAAFADLQAFGDMPTKPALRALNRRLRFNQASSQVRRDNI